MVNPKLLLNGAKVFLSTNSPAILTGLGITGVVATAVSTGKAVWAMRDVEGDISINDIKDRWKTFLVPIALAGGTILCFIGINNKYGRILAAVTSVATLKEQELLDTKNAMGKILKGGDVEKVKQASAKEMLARNPQPDERLIIQSGHGNDLFYDPLSGRYFRSSMEAIKKGIKEVNEMLNNGNFVSISEVYNCWDIPGTELGDVVYLDPKTDPAFHLEILDIDLTQAHVTDKGEAAVVLEWRNDFNSFLSIR